MRLHLTIRGLATFNAAFKTVAVDSKRSSVVALLASKQLRKELHEVPVTRCGKCPEQTGQFPEQRPAQRQLLLLLGIARFSEIAPQVLRIDS